MNKKKIIIIIVLSILIAGFSAFQWFIQKEFKKYSPAVEMNLKNEDLAYGNLLQQKEYINGEYVVAFTKERPITYEGKEMKITGIDDNYRKFQPLSIIYGNDLLKEQDQVLISDSLSNKLFGTDNSVGKLMNLEGKSYKVVGIYQRSSLKKIIGLDQEVLYVPLNEIQENDQRADAKILFGNKEGKNEPFFKEKLVEYLSKEIPDLHTEKLALYDYTDCPLIVSQFFYGSIFLAELLLFIFITVILIRKIKAYKNQYSMESQTKYMSEIFSENLTDILLEMIKMILLLFVWIFLLRLIIMFQFDIPGRVLPTEDIFDFKFYAQLHSKSNLYYSISSYGQIYERTLKIACMDFAFLAAASVILLGYVLRLNRIKERMI